VIVVLAYAGDQFAAELAKVLSARVVTARELSTSGWQHHPIGTGDEVLGLADGAVSATALRGVVTRVGAIGAPDLPHIVPEDRDYVAAEMSAFLLSFLHALPCPVVNRPTPMSLMGPGWTTQRWRAAAVAIGLPVAESAEGTSVTVVGDRCFGPASLAQPALALARHAGVELLTTRFSPDGAVIDVDPWARVPEAAALALRERFA
jgi:hypothetical protein